MASTGRMNVTVWGDGEPAVLVHGSLSSGPSAWAHQRTLAGSYRLLLVDRRGFGDSPGPDAGDFAVDAGDVFEVLPPDAHLVGHSYGAVVSLLAAARRPDAVRSLTVIEPPAFSLVRGEPAVEELIARIADATDSACDAGDYRRRFFTAFGLPPPEQPFEGNELRNAASSWRERPPWEAEIALDALRSGSFPTLVVRGGWDLTPPDAQAVARSAFHAVCDALVTELGAKSVTISGVAHAAQRAGEEFNERLRAFWESA